MRILDRYLLRELAIPFSLGLAVFTSILLIARILKLVEMVVNRGVPFLRVLELFSYILPAFLEVTIPMALLLAVLIAFGRLSSDSEIIALQASGVGLSRLAVPVAWFSIFIALLTLFVSITVRPWGNSRLRSGLFEIVKARPSAGIRAKVFNDDFKNLVIYVEDIDGDNLRGIVLSDRRTGSERNTIFARSGIVVSSEENATLTLRLIDGSIYTTGKEKKGYQDTRFTTYDLNLNVENVLSNDDKKRERDVSELNFAELRATIRDKEAAGEPAWPERVELHRKFAISFACLVFSALALPLGIRPTRAVHSWGFSVSLALIFIYYVLLTLGQSLGERGALPPFLAIWIPNLLLSPFAVYLLTRRDMLSGRVAANRLAPFPRAAAALRRVAQQWRGTAEES